MVARGFALVVGLGLVLSSAACHMAGGNGARVRPTGRLQVAKAGSTDLYPLTPGLQWEYRLRQRQGNGPIQERTLTMGVIRAEEVAPGVTEAVLERHYPNLTPPLTRVRHHADRVVLSRLTDPVDGPSITIMKLPLVMGMTWPGRALGGGHREDLFAKGLESIDIPAGHFEAQRVDHLIRYAQGGDDTLSYWYAPGAGMIKMIERSTLESNGHPVHLEVTGELMRTPTVTPPYGRSIDPEARADNPIEVPGMGIFQAR